MRKFKALILFVAVCAAVAVNAEKREHRATWMSGYISDWPTQALTEANVEAQKTRCLMDLDSLVRYNMTTIYYHVRTMCDAMYDSKYEPWSSYIAGTRGTTPPLDPLRFILDESHKRGLEVYAWFNPYRYLNSSVMTGWGNNGGDKNYENSHPDWLIEYHNGSTTHTILNPALPEVKQRIVDVIADLLGKYDVDGVVFDDYFYQNGLPMSYDAEQYEAYVAGGGTLSQGDWRRENVNDMVRMVNAYIKANKPWVRFGIGPAGVACSSQEVADKYGVEPSPGSDWQYNGIYSDPMAWISEGSIDFISPQVYWPIGYDAADYGLITPWWYEVAKKFNRHCYISQDISANFGTESNANRDLDEFVEEVELNRSSDKVGGTSGVVYFPWKDLRSDYKLVNRRQVKLSSYLRYNVFQTKSLTPAVTWIKAECPGAVTGVTRSGRTISWLSDMDNVRYTVYAVPADETGSFHKEAEYLLGISYSDSFEIPVYDSKYPEQGVADADLDKYAYAVCVLDRYGNEYSAVFEGADVTQAAKPVPSYPLNGTKTGPAFRFQWSGDAAVYEIEISDDPEMKNILTKKEVTGNYVASTDIWDFDAETTYYWTVTARGNNTIETVSDVNGFTVDTFRITSPENEQTDCPDNVTIGWSNVEGGEYHLEISNNLTFALVTYSVDTDKTSVTVPECVLSGGTTYYARVSSSSDGVEFTSEPVCFTTAVIVPDVPVFVTPSENGETLYSNWVIEVEPERGIRNCNVMICNDNSFTPRRSYNGTFTDFVFKTPELGDVNIISTPLVDGTTYYVRARFSYVNEEGVPTNTDWTEPMTFVYNAEAGVGDVADEGIVFVGGDEPAVVANEPGVEVSVYGMDGRLRMVAVTDASGRAPLSGLAEGAYMVVVRSESEVKTFKLVR